MRKTFHEYVLSHGFQYFLLSAGSGETLAGLVHLATILLRRINRQSFSSQAPGIQPSREPFNITKLYRERGVE